MGPAKDKRLISFWTCIEADLFGYSHNDRPLTANRVDKPRVHSFARWQAMNGLDTFTTLLGENIAFGNDIVRLLVILLDGTRDRQSVIEEVLDRLQIPPDQTEKARSSIPEIVNANIEQLRQLGVFAH